MKCKDCNASCLGISSDECIVWTGPSFPTLGIETGYSYSINVVKLAAELSDLIEKNVVDLKCLGDGIVPLPEGVQVIVDKICSLNDTDITTTANLYCLGSNVSTCAASISKKSFSYNLYPTTNGITFTYDSSSTLDNLPPGITAGKFNLTAEGIVDSGSIVVADTENKIGGFNIPVSRLPAVITVKCRLGSSCGDIELYKRIAITSPVNKSFNTEFGLNDYSYGASSDGPLLQKDFNELAASELCKQRSELESLKTIEIEDCDDIIYPDDQINSVIQVQGAVLCDLSTKLKNIGERLIKTKDCNSNCEEQIKEMTLQEWINKTDDNICQMLDQLQNHEADINYIKQRLDSCCAAGSSAPGYIPGGGCPGGNCQ
jgi:hypothetical protein